MFGSKITVIAINVLFKIRGNFKTDVLSP